MKCELRIGKAYQTLPTGLARQSLNADHTDTLSTSVRVKSVAV